LVNIARWFLHRSGELLALAIPGKEEGDNKEITNNNPEKEGQGYEDEMLRKNQSSTYWKRFVNTVKASVQR
jgi:hypothetical protein